MKILFIGMGYVGTTMGAVFANAGHEVSGLDINQEKIASLTKGELYFYEPGLQEMLVSQIGHERLSFTTDAKEAIENHDILFITVGTPSLEDGNADLTYVKKVAQMIGRYKNMEKTIVVKSTVPIGTTNKVKEWINEESTDPNPVHIAMNPEFLREGNALQDALYPDRIIIGSDDEEALETMHKLYQSWKCPILQTTAMAAETIKYASNAFLATKISFINEMAKLCDTLGVNIKDVSKGMGLDERIGPHFLEAGLGYGGSCFPKDVKELLGTAEAYQRPLGLLKEVEKINKNQCTYFFEKLKKSFDTLEGKRIVLFGLAFKPHTDDTRESVSFPIIDQLLKEKASVAVHDPVVHLSKDWITKGIKQYSDPYDAVEGSDAILICTDWPQYQELDWERVRHLVNEPSIFDGRNMLEANQIKALQFQYTGIGYS
ncbi:UDP-glucose dehydrogenase family protein [Oceanobacillus sp. CF4.6]|uniref:UDP-glucose dehydrogenase family protein n=1 Tax=Oceanobacillus sp. CF4.6 TaxID=3373080 RepID=UPI003EE71B8D